MLTLSKLFGRISAYISITTSHASEMLRITYCEGISTVAFNECIIGGQYQTEEIQQHDRRHNPSVKFAKQRLFFLWVDVDMILNGVVLLLVCRIWCVGRCLFHLEIHREWVKPREDRVKAAKPKELMMK